MAAGQLRAQGSGLERRCGDDGKQPEAHDDAEFFGGVRGSGEQEVDRRDTDDLGDCRDTEFDGAVDDCGELQTEYPNDLFSEEVSDCRDVRSVSGIRSMVDGSNVHYLSNTFEEREAACDQRVDAVDERTMRSRRARRTFQKRVDPVQGALGYCGFQSIEVVEVVVHRSERDASVLGNLFEGWIYGPSEDKFAVSVKDRDSVAFAPRRSAIGFRDAISHHSST